MGLGGSSPPKVLEESAILSIIIKIIMNTTHLKMAKAEKTA